MAKYVHFSLDNAAPGARAVCGVQTDNCTLFEGAENCPRCTKRLMRKRAASILREVERLQMQCPDLRIGQILSNVVATGNGCQDIFHISDYALLERLRYYQPEIVKGTHGRRANRNRG